MLEGATTEKLDDAEAEFRRRLSEKLAARGYVGAALESKIAVLLSKEAPLRLWPDEAANLPRP